MRWLQLDNLGLGLAGDVSNVPPGILSFLSGPDRVDYLNVSGHATQLERLRHYVDSIRESTPMVFHALNFNPALEREEPDWLVRRTREIVEYVGARWAAQDLGVWLLGSTYQDALLLPPILDTKSIAPTAEKIKFLEAALGVPFFVENPPFCVVAEEMHLLEYLAELSRAAACGIVLDIGHLFIYQLASGRGLLDMPIDSFPFDRVAEVHIAGLDESGFHSAAPRYVDRHDLPIREECWEFLQEFLPRMTNIKGVTLEQEHCSEDLVRTHIRRAREILAR